MIFKFFIESFEPASLNTWNFLKKKNENTPEDKKLPHFQRSEQWNLKNLSTLQ